MSVIAVYSIKGGVGKTTTAFDLAWRFAAQGGHRTLLWDLDIQGGAAFMLGEAQPRSPRAAAAFRPGGLLRQQVRGTRFDRLFLLPADPSLRILPNQLAQMRQRNRLDWLTDFLSGEFRRIVLDCPPALNEVSDQVIAAADLIVVPLPASPLSMRALDAIRQELAHNHLRPPPIMPVLTMYDPRRAIHRETRATLAQDWPVVPLSGYIEQTAVRRAPIDTFAPQCNGARALAGLFEQVEARLAELQQGPDRGNRPVPTRPVPTRMVPPRDPAATAEGIPAHLLSPPPEAGPLLRAAPRKRRFAGLRDAVRRALQWVLRV